MTVHPALHAALVAASTPAKKSGSSATSTIFLLVIVVGVAAVFIMSRRSKQRVAARGQRPLEVDTEVITRSGIVGWVREVGPEEIKVEIAPDVRVRMVPGAVIRREEFAERQRPRPGLFGTPRAQPPPEPPRAPD